MAYGLLCCYDHSILIVCLGGWGGKSENILVGVLALYLCGLHVARRIGPLGSCLSNFELEYFLIRELHPSTCADILIVINLLTISRATLQLPRIRALQPKSWNKALARYRSDNLLVGFKFFRDKGLADRKDNEKSRRKQR